MASVNVKPISDKVLQYVRNGVKLLDIGKTPADSYINGKLVTDCSKEEIFQGFIYVLEAMNVAARDRTR